MITLRTPCWVVTIRNQNLYLVASAIALLYLVILFRGHYHISADQVLAARTFPDQLGRRGAQAQYKESFQSSLQDTMHAGAPAVATADAQPAFETQQISPQENQRKERQVPGKVINNMGNGKLEDTQLFGPGLTSPDNQRPQSATLAQDALLQPPAITWTHKPPGRPVHKHEADNPRPAVTLRHKKGPALHLPAVDRSPRCVASGICDGNFSCGVDGLGCVKTAAARRQHIVNATRLSWAAYKQYAWGEDELQPLSRTGRRWFDLGITIVDSLDTLMLMGLEEEYAGARQWVHQNLTFDNPDPTHVSVFETTIRVLGGLLAAFYHSGGDQLYSNKADDFGSRLMAAFHNSHNGFARPLLNLLLAGQHGEVEEPAWTSDPFSTCFAEVGSLSVELSALTYLTGNEQYRAAGMQFFSVLATSSTGHDGMFCRLMNSAFGCYDSTYSLGASADSTYEYMLKQWIISGRQDKASLEMYKAAMRGVRNHLVMRGDTGCEAFVYPGQAQRTLGGGGHAEADATSKPVLEHLACFAPGMMALGWMYGVDTGQDGEEDDLTLAVKLARGCYHMYLATITGLSADSLNVALPTDLQDQRVGGYGNSTCVPQYTGLFEYTAHNNLLRPELIESFFYLYRATGDEIYRDWGWSIFRSFQMHSLVPGGAGYMDLQDVTIIPPLPGDKMESFWISETLKYFYLLFSPKELLPLEQYVFNTEAHPLPIHGTAMERLRSLAQEGLRQRSASSTDASVARAQERPVGGGGTGAGQDGVEQA